MTVHLADLEDKVVTSFKKHGIIREMTVSDLLSAPSPMQVSNRTIYDRCLAWGCKVTRTNGNWVWMVSPMQARFKVRPPQQHEANGKPIIDKMLDSVALPWTVFIQAEILDLDALKELARGFRASDCATEYSDDEMGPCSVCGDSVIRAVLAKSGKKIAHKYCLPKKGEAQPDPQPPKESEPVPEPEIIEEHRALLDDPNAEIDEGGVFREDPVGTPRHRYINSVFDLLVERGDPMSNQAVAEVLGISPAQAGSAMTSLCNQGVVTRVKAGVYQAKPHILRRSGTLGLVVSGDGTVDHSPSFGTVPSGYAVQPTTRISTTAQPVPGTEPNEEEDETLNELIDLIAPNGFRARHLPLIDSFKRSALALMREVNGGA